MSCSCHIAIINNEGLKVNDYQQTNSASNNEVEIHHQFIHIFSFYSNLLNSLIWLFWDTVQSIRRHSIINIEKWQQHRRSASRNIFCIVFVSAIILSRISFVLHPSSCNNTYSNSQNQHSYLQLNHDQKLKHIYFKLLLACLTTKKNKIRSD